MACNLEELVSLGICPDEGADGQFKLINAPGISIKNLANIATESYTSGVNLAMEKKALTILQFKNDFIGALQSNNVIAYPSKPEYTTSIFNPNSSMGTFAGDRGVVLHKAKWKGKLRNTVIKSIDCYPMSSGAGSIKIIEGNRVTEWTVNFTAGTVNTFDADNLIDFPYTLSPYSEYVKVVIDQTTIAFSSAEVTCKTGCGGQAPNICGWAEGWDGVNVQRRESYGVNVNFYCECDYSQIICDTAYTQELLWLKWQINIFEEELKSNRFNGLVIYNHEELPVQITDLYNKYNAKWQSLMDGMYGLLQSYNDSCLNCRGIRIRTNI